MLPLPAPQAGVWMFRLSVCFQDQHGAPATLDPDAGLTSRVTAEAYEFYRGASKSDESGAVNTLATALFAVAGHAVAGRGEHGAGVCHCRPRHRHSDDGKRWRHSSKRRS